MTELQTAWLRAWRVAARAHARQTLPGRDLPYLVHLGSVGMELLVAHQLAPFERPSLAVQCGLLHDTLEDTTVSESELSSLFSQEVVSGVRALTKDPALRGAEAMADSLRRIREQPREIWAVKLADRISNLAAPPHHWAPAKVEEYKREAESILVSLRDAHGPLAHRLEQCIARYPHVPEPEW